MDKVLVSPSASDRLCATEMAIENAIADAARILPNMVQARLDLRISVVVGDDATGKAAQEALGETRRRLVEARWSREG